MERSGRYSRKGNADPVTDPENRKGIIMWLAIFATAMIVAAAAALYLAGKIKRTGIFSAINSKALVWILSFIAVAVITAVLCFVLDGTNTIIIFIHLAVFLLVGDLVAFILRKAGGRDVSTVVDIIAVILCIVYLCIAWYQMHGLWETDYTIASLKSTGGIRIAHIADSHVGCGFDGKGFGERLERIKAAQPDILVITGDFVDDDTGKQDMIDACAALGDFDAKYGVYFCFGNHDSGYYSSERRGYGKDDLIAELTKNGVVVLQDESVLIDDRFYVIGRLDAGYGGSKRETPEELVKDLDKSKYMIMLDHQPTDYEAEEAAGVDLVLSGHTHGGQLWPLEYVQPLISENDNVRGLERRGNTDFIVTDGISDWAIKFRTGCRSEFNIINVQ